jgi:hypothetical protein
MQWGLGMSSVALQLWRYYNNTALLHSIWPAQVKWMDLLDASAGPEHVLTNGLPEFTDADWGCDAPDMALMGTAFLAYQVRALLSQFHVTSDLLSVMFLAFTGPAIVHDSSHYRRYGQRHAIR